MECVRSRVAWDRMDHRHVLGLEVRVSVRARVRIRVRVSARVRVRVRVRAFAPDGSQVCGVESLSGIYIYIHAHIYIGYIHCIF